MSGSLLWAISCDWHSHKVSSNLSGIQSCPRRHREPWQRKLPICKLLRLLFPCALKIGTSSWGRQDSHLKETDQMTEWTCWKNSLKEELALKEVVRVHKRQTEDSSSYTSSSSSGPFMSMPSIIRLIHFIAGRSRAVEVPEDQLYLRYHHHPSSSPRGFNTFRTHRMPFIILSTGIRMYVVVTIIKIFMKLKHI